MTIDEVVKKEKKYLKFCVVCLRVELPDGSVAYRTPEMLKKLRENYWFSSSYLSKECLKADMERTGRFEQNKELYRTIPNDKCE